MSVSSVTSANRLVLLFLHGAGYNQDCWKPILRRLTKAPLLQRVPNEIVSFNWRFHGEKRDSSIAPKVVFRDGIKTSPRVEHPMRAWPDWAPKDLFDEIQKIRADDAKLSRRTHIVGIGHSMGASSLIKVELKNPGTLDGVIAFEPVYSDGSFATEFKDKVVDMLVGVTLAREAEWDSHDDVLHHMNTARNFKRWDKESIQAFLENGVEMTDDGKRWRLVMSPTVEASVYCHDFDLVTFRAANFAEAKCNIVLEHAEKTPFFRADIAQTIAAELPNKLFVSEAIPNTTHSLTVEDPETCARRILDGLEKFPVFQTAPTPAKL